MTSVGFPEERFGYNFMKKAKTQNLKTQRKRREQRFLGVVKRWQIIIPGPKRLPCLCFFLRVSTPPAVSAVKGFGCGYVALSRFMLLPFPALMQKMPRNTFS